MSLQDQERNLFSVMAFFQVFFTYCQAKQTICQSVEMITGKFFPAIKTLDFLAVHNWMLQLTANENFEGD